MLDSPVEEIKLRLPILDLVQDFVQLKKAGTNYKGLCPFHGEKTPSFMVSPSKQIWHCFGCGLGGDIFEFIKQMENVEFADALKILADRTGVELRKQTFQQVQTAQKKDILYEINDQAAKYYAKVLWDSQAGSEALQYLRGRGLTDQTIKNWQLGFAPDDYHYLENFLAKNFDKKDIVLAGLIIKSDKDNSYFDRFHDRVMFPIINLHGQVVGFTGRLLHDKPNTGKYVNSPETPIYNKSREIYGLYQAKNAIRKENRALLVEGNMDVITCHQAGFNMAVATSGTALTEYQLVILRRFTENLVLAFDSDAAGTSAMRRVIEPAYKLGFNVKYANLGKFKDPDELVKKGIGWFDKVVNSAGNFIDFFFDKTFVTYHAETLEGKREITKELAPLIYLIADPITKAHYIRKLATGINVAESAVWDIINKISVPKAVRAAAQERRKTRREILEDQVLGLSLLEASDEYLHQLNLTIPPGKEEFLKFAAEVDMKEQGLDPKVELPKIANELGKMMLKERMQAVAARLTSAETAKDKELVQKLSQEYTDLINQMSK